MKSIIQKWKQLVNFIINNISFFILFILFVFILNITIGNTTKMLFPFLALILVIFYYNKINGLIIIILSIFFYLVYYYINKNNLYKESFWSPELLKKFILTERTLNRGLVFDPVIVQEQASEQDVKYFLKNNKWYWPKQVEEIYKKSTDKNTIVRTHKNDSMNYAKSIYNKNAILELLALQTDEGKLLINGVEKNIPTDSQDQPSYAYNSGLLPRYNSIIKCDMTDRNNVRMQQTFYPPLGSLNTPSKEYVDYNDLENAIPGFKFIKEPCEPCIALNAMPDYSCPFSLKTKNNPSGIVSGVWEYLWNLTPIYKINKDKKHNKNIAQIKKSITNKDISMITGVSSSNPNYKKF